VRELLKDERRTFTQVEMKFFTMWWERQTEQTREDVRKLVKERRLVFVNAGWAMMDEACTHHDDMMNNMMIGHEFLRKEFDFVPSIGWHVDPFGHSAATPRLMADMGFEAWFFARIDYEDQERRMKNKEMQWVWKPMHDALGDQVEILTTTFQDMYWYPQPFDNDVREEINDNVIADERLTTFNAKSRVSDLRDYALHMQQHYRGNHMFIPWGEDFAYTNAFNNFKSTDALIDYFNDTYDDMTVLYSNPYKLVEAWKD